MRPEIPQTRYATTIDGVHIAYQVLGAGPLDLIYLPEWISNVELQWEEPRHERFLRGLASRARLITIDRRGTGLSDRVAEDTPALEASMDDLLAVMAALEIERAVVCGVLEGACASALFGATYPERTAGLILFGAFARGLPAPDYPSAWTEQQWRDEDALVEERWGTPGFSDDVLRYTAPTNADDPVLRRW